MSEQPNADAAWLGIVDWLAQYAPRSHATLLPSATEAEMAEAQVLLATAWRPEGEEPLRFPTELLALWRLCASATNNGAGVEGDEEGELWPELFLPPEGIFLPPKAAAQARLNLEAVDGDRRYWTPSHNVPCIVKYPDAVESGLYVRASTGPAQGVMGSFAVYEGYEIAEPSFPSLAAYLGAVAEVLRHGTGPLGEDKKYRPAVSLGCLVWIDPDDPHLDDVPWELVHPDHG
ncbi:hypothetical protein ACFWWT_41835 [Streptomyces sp. NPDC058676]|uniref:hypothetical protein n=1 Tax=unclassified Streptomyces TaxID=2593676 RepID=UPI0036688781